MVVDVALEPLVLDNLVDSIDRASKRTDLLPVFSFNGTGLWLAKQRGKGKLAGSAIMRMKRRHPDRYSLLRRRRIRIGQAEGLAETERVKRPLEASGLRIEDIEQYTIPQLVAKILSPMSPERARSLVNETPKFREYLRKTEDEALRSLIKEKGLASD